MKKIICISLILAICLSCCACGQIQLDAWKYDESRAKTILAEFTEIETISRKSGYCDRMTEYLLSYFDGRNVNVTADDYGNVIVDVPASSGYEKKPLCIVHSAMDINASGLISLGDYYNPINVVSLDGRISGESGMLGADTGMGMAVIMQLLESDKAHGPIRMLFTADSNDGFAGAYAIDEQYLQDAKYLINVNNESSRSMITSAYGETMLTAEIIRPAVADPTLDSEIQISVSGLIGGSAAYDIDRGRINGAYALLKILRIIRDAGIPFELVRFYGGSNSEEILTDASVIMYVNNEDVSQLWNMAVSDASDYQYQYSQTDPGLNMNLVRVEVDYPVMTQEERDMLLDYSEAAVNGVLSDTASVNFGEIDYSTERAYFRQIIRSESNEELEKLTKERIELLQEKGFTVGEDKLADVWEAKKNGKLTDISSQVYSAMFGSELKAEGTRNGNEIGAFLSKNSNLEAVSIGLDVWDCGTPEEFCNLESSEKLLSMLENLLQEIK